MTNSLLFSGHFYVFLIIGREKRGKDLKKYDNGPCREASSLEGSLENLLEKRDNKVST